MRAWAPQVILPAVKRHRSQNSHKVSDLDDTKGKVNAGIPDGIRLETRHLVRVCLQYNDFVSFLSPRFCGDLVHEESKAVPPLSCQMQAVVWQEVCGCISNTESWGYRRL